MSTNKLRKALKEAGMKQGELAAALAVEKSTISRLLSGERAIKMETAVRIVEILRERTGKRRGLTLDSLFGRAA